MWGTLNLNLITTNPCAKINAQNDAFKFLQKHADTVPLHFRNFWACCQLFFLIFLRRRKRIEKIIVFKRFPALKKYHPRMLIAGMIIHSSFMGAVYLLARLWAYPQRRVVLPARAGVDQALRGTRQNLRGRAV